ncbi:RNA polymerase sigma-70 factor, ECF subfamily [Thalassospira xiamenensis M-5 = DSM 17429]|uniref:RNA polymerase ECF sigma factor (Sigma70) n=1 Tax=Thalassospira xiamenensis M-5 = DSM 17429 TaxID=1123366 RepID=A0AB72UET7_9PROT|nr:sigma-70 family RNA polymerase sigma factor [Thalassospira xiamenensis]AJD52831.1 RNA polymerase ECF sigma factor (sigma70) [Thalassospira xiamenensis M-5 = DSM 17429]SIT31174.1 RNA polymerase sigma-70 factor, ECF subfamily [Thalassospira xiamenensis M-5 = DSM 17429]
MTVRDRFWDGIYQQYHGRLLRQVQKYLPAGEESHDVLQDLYIQLRKRAVDPCDVDNPPAYLMRMATNLAIDTLRRRNRNPLDFTDPADLADIPDAIGGSVTPEQISADRQRIAIVGRAIDGLPPRCRDAFLLCKRDHLSPAEAAEALGISRNMVEKHLRHALKHCRTMLARYEN